MRLQSMKELVYRSMTILGMASLILAAAASCSGIWREIGSSSDSDAKMAAFHNSSTGASICNYQDNDSGFFKYTQDGGAAWKRVPGELHKLFGMEWIDAQTVIACGEAAQIWQSRDGGKNWQQLANFGPPFAMNSVTYSARKPLSCKNLSFIDAQTGWIAGPRDLGATRDGGKSWQTITLPQGIADIDAIALRSVNEGYLFDASGSGKLFITKDGGKTWSSRTLQLKGAKIENAYLPMAVLRMNADGKGMLITNRQGGQLFALVTSDGGESWQEETVPGKFGALFLARDLKTLTITGMYGDIKILQRN